MNLFIFLYHQHYCLNPPQPTTEGRITRSRALKASVPEVKQPTRGATVPVAKQPTRAVSVPQVKQPTRAVSVPQAKQPTRAAAAGKKAPGLLSYYNTQYMWVTFQVHLSLAFSLIVDQGLMVRARPSLKNCLLQVTHAGFKTWVDRPEFFSSPRRNLM